MIFEGKSHFFTPQYIAAMATPTSLDVARLLAEQKHFVEADAVIHTRSYTDDASVTSAILNSKLIAGRKRRIEACAALNNVSRLSKMESAGLDLALEHNIFPALQHAVANVSVEVLDHLCRLPSAATYINKPFAGSNGSQHVLLTYLMRQGHDDQGRRSLKLRTADAETRAQSRASFEARMDRLCAALAVLLAVPGIDVNVRLQAKHGLPRNALCITDFTAPPARMLVQLLSAPGIDPNVPMQSDQQDPVLAWWCSSFFDNLNYCTDTLANRLTVVDKLLSLPNINVNLYGRSGMTALHTACRCCQDTLAERLLARADLGPPEMSPSASLAIEQEDAGGYYREYRDNALPRDGEPWALRPLLEACEEPDGDNYQVGDEEDVQAAAADPDPQSFRALRMLRLFSRVPGVDLSACSDVLRVIATGRSRASGTGHPIARETRLRMAMQEFPQLRLTFGALFELVQLTLDPTACIELLRSVPADEVTAVSTVWPRNWTLLTSAIWKCPKEARQEVVQYLLAYPGMPVAHVCPTTGVSAFMVACHRSDVAVVRQIAACPGVVLAGTCTWDHCCSGGGTALHMAVRNSMGEDNAIAIVQFLLSLQTGSSDTAADGGASSRTRLLDLNALNTSEFTALHTIAKFARLQLFQVLLAAGADPNKLHPSYRTTATEKLLTEARISPVSLSSLLPILRDCVQHPSFPGAPMDVAVALVVELGAFRDGISADPPSPDCTQAQVELMQLMALQGAPMDTGRPYPYDRSYNRPAETGYTPLMQACHLGRVAVVEFLLSLTGGSAVRVNASASMGRTPLDFARAPRPESPSNVVHTAGGVQIHAVFAASESSPVAAPQSSANGSVETAEPASSVETLQTFKDSCRDKIMAMLVAAGAVAAE